MCKKILTSIYFINELHYKYSKDVFGLVKMTTKNNSHVAIGIFAGYWPHPTRVNGTSCTRSLFADVSQLQLQQLIIHTCGLAAPGSGSRG